MVHAELGNVVVVTCLIEKNALLDAQDKVCQYICNGEREYQYIVSVGGPTVIHSMMTYPSCLINYKYILYS